MSLLTALLMAIGLEAAVIILFAFFIRMRVVRARRKRWNEEAGVDTTLPALSLECSRMATEKFPAPTVSQISTKTSHSEYCHFESSSLKAMQQSNSRSNQSQNHDHELLGNACLPQTLAVTSGRKKANEKTPLVPTPIDPPTAYMYIWPTYAAVVAKNLGDCKQAPAAFQPNQPTTF